MDSVDIRHQVIDANSGVLLFEGPIGDCRDYIIKSNNEFATLR